jgi:hypothetical protein
LLLWHLLICEIVAHPADRSKELYPIYQLVVVGVEELEGVEEEQLV